MTTTKFGFTITADIHGMTTMEAKKELTRLLNTCDKSIKEIDVLHGYHGGTALLNLVRKELRHPRLVKRVLTLNQGMTTLVIKPWVEEKLCLKTIMSF